MKITTNLKSGPNGPGLDESDILEIHVDEQCEFIALEVMNEYRFIWHSFRGSPVLIDQEDSTAVAHVKLKRYLMSLVGKHLLKVIAYGVDNQEDELDTEFYIYPQGAELQTVS